MPSRFISTVKLYHVDEIGNGRFPAFSTINKQQQFFTARLKDTVNNCKIIRGRGSVRVNVPTKTFYKDINYISYVNPDYDNKTMYAFVTGYNYINDQCTEISFAIDFIQTFMFDVECVGTETSIEREHMSSERKALATANPYRWDLWELGTTENLPVSRDFEEWGYKFKSHAATASGAYTITEDAELMLPDASMFKYVMYVSQIDFTDLNAMATKAGVTPLPSDIFESFLDTTNIGASDFVIDFDGTVHAGSDYTGSKLVSYFPNTCAIFCLPKTGNSDKNIDKLIEYLTKWNCVSSIVNILVIPQSFLKVALFNDSTGTALRRISVMKPTLEHDGAAVSNEKLYRYPYSFIRLTLPDSNEKELQWERFYELAGDPQGSSHGSSATHVDIGVGCDIISMASLVCAPIGYDNTYLHRDATWADDTNSNQSIVFNQFPTAPYNIDASLSAFSAMAAERARKDTLTYSKDWAAENYGLGARTSSGYLATETGSTAMSALTGTGASVTDEWGNGNTLNVTAGFSNPLNIAQTAKNIMETGIAQEQRKLAYDAKITDLQVTENAAAYLVGDDNGLFAKNYMYTAGTYAANKYVPPSGGGFEYFTLYGWLNIACQRVKLREEILKIYDAYFDSYGYTSGRTGVPYVMKFIDSTITSDNPQWVNGETYVKTAGAKFKGTFQYVCELWARTFDSGIHWLNGDELING